MSPTGPESAPRGTTILMPLVPLLPELPPASARELVVSREVPKPTGEGEHGAENGGGFTPAQVLHALRRRWFIAIPLALTMAVVVYLGAESRLTPVYTARTLIHVSPDKRGILYDNAGGR